MIFLKRHYTWLYLHEKEADEDYKISAANIFTKATCTQNYSRFYVEGQQELRPFYM